MKLSGLAQVRDRVAAARVLQHRGMVDLRRVRRTPDQRLVFIDQLPRNETGEVLGKQLVDR